MPPNILEIIAQIKEFERKKPKKES